MNGWLLAVDTATAQATVALGTPDGRLVVERGWTVGHTHSETVLPALRELLTASGVAPADLVGIVAGTGPGGFTGLRVGLATAKTLAHGLGIPLLGIATTDALALAACSTDDADVLVLLSGGPAHCYAARVRVGRDGSARAVDAVRLVAPADVGPLVADLACAGARIVALGMHGEAPGWDGPEGDASLASAALAGLGAALLRLGAAGLAEGRRDDPAELVPTYVTLPRGVAPHAGGATWSPDLR